MRKLRGSGPEFAMTEFSMQLGVWWQSRGAQRIELMHKRSHTDRHSGAAPTTVCDRSSCARRMAGSTRLECGRLEIVGMAR